MNKRVLWNLDSNCYCPRCDNFVNILEYDEFLGYYKFIDPRDRSIDLTPELSRAEGVGLDELLGGVPTEGDMK